MSFSSFNFLLALPLFVLSFWLLPRRAQKAWLVFLSFLVYISAGWSDLALLVAAVGANWAAHRLGLPRRAVAKALVVLDVAFLAWFKYRGFVGGLLGHSLASELIIPLGISFYTFQLISFQVELLRGQLEEYPKFWDFFLYIFFFPHHQAGPIMRPHAFLICFTKARSFFSSRLLTGILIFLWGLFKKVWIADQIAPKVDLAYYEFHTSGGHSGSLIALAVLFGIQIYGDFSGYSDMAVGLGRCFGFKFDRNFHQPYLAQGPAAFWRRWHVTLSQWLRDFVYIPLGGNRGGQGRTLANLMLTMLIGGFWHGAGWAFLLWGGLHGAYLVAERLLPAARGWVRWPRFIVFQLLVMLAWVPFREPDLGAIWAALGRKSAWMGGATDHALKLFIALLAFSWLEERLERGFVRIFKSFRALPAPALALVLGGLAFLVLCGAGSATTFIYQRF